jgi:hypothetical protein
VPSPEDQEHIQRAHACVKECHIEHLINESKFLRLDSLQELVKVCCSVYAYQFECQQWETEHVGSSSNAGDLYSGVV